MTAAFFIALREGLEAALIVGIVAAYLVKIGRRDALPGIWAGVVAALSISIAVGVVVVATVGKLPIVIQEGIEGVTAIVAVGVLGWMLFWMRRQGRALKGDLERGVDSALAGVARSRSPAWRSSRSPAKGSRPCSTCSPSGSRADRRSRRSHAILVGLVIAGGIGWAIFAAGIRIDLRRFFTSRHRAHLRVGRADGLCGCTRSARPGSSPTPARRSTSARPARVEPARRGPGGLVRVPLGADPARGHRLSRVSRPGAVPVHLGGRSRVTGPATAAAVTLLVAFVLAACSGGAASPSTAASTGSGATVKVGASEYKFDPNALTVAAGPVTFEVTNNGTEEHEFEVFKGDLVVDEIEGLVPGLTRSLASHPRRGRVHVRVQAGRARPCRDDRHADRHRELTPTRSRLVGEGGDRAG
jgi:high-affinity iron transporter